MFWEAMRFLLETKQNFFCFVYFFHKNDELLLLNRTFCKLDIHRRKTTELFVVKYDPIYHEKACSSLGDDGRRLFVPHKWEKLLI